MKKRILEFASTYAMETVSLLNARGLIKFALVGFATYQDAKNLKEQIGGKICRLRKKQEWNYYEITRINSKAITVDDVEVMALEIGQFSYVVGLVID